MMFLSSLRRLFSRSATRSCRARRPGRLWLECLEDRTLPSVVNWIGGSGNWNDINHWLDATTGTNHTPTASDDAIIDVAGVTVTHGSGTDTVHSLSSNEPLLLSGGSLTLAADSTLNSTLAMSNGTLAAQGVLNLNDLFTWSGGTLNGTGHIEADGGLLISGSSGQVLTGSQTLENSGGATWTGTGFFQILGDGVFNNLAGATFDDHTDASIGSPSIFTGAGTFNNAGMFVKSAGTGVTYATQLTINNSGTVEAMSGTLDLAGAHDAARRSISTGAFLADPGATLEFGAGYQALASTATVSGAGNVIFDSETFTNLHITIDGDYHVNGLTTFRDTNAPFGNPDVTFTGSVEMGALNMGAGTLKSHGIVTVDGALSWTGGTLAGRGQINANGSLNISGNSGVALSGVTLNNVGAATWSGTGNISGSNGAVFNNLAGASFEVQGDASFGGGGTRFNNAGAFLKSMGSGATTINSSFNSTGTLRDAAGTLDLAGGGIGRGSFSADAGRTLQFGGGTLTLAATSSVNGDGHVVVSGGTVNVEGGYSNTGDLTVSGGMINFDVNVNLSALTLSGGTLSGVGDVVVAGLLTWTGGTMSGQGQTDANGSLVISGNNNKSLDSRTLNNAGAGIWSGTGNLSTSNGAIFNNLAGGSFEVQGDATFGGGGTRFNNAGAFLKSMGSGATVINAPFANSGTFDVASGIVNLTNGGVGQGSYTVEAAKTLQWGGGTQTLTTTSSVNGGGNVVVSGGIVNVEGDYSITGATTVSGGTVNFDVDVGLSTLTLSSGTLSGVGDVAVAGLLTWTGGTMSGQGQTDANGSLVISGNNNKGLDSRTLNNAGAATWSGTGSISGSNAVFNNLAAATFEVQGDATFGDSSSVFNNAGAVFKSMGSGATTINTFVYNTGSIEVDSGALTVNNDFVNAGYLSPGGNGHTAVLTINGNYIQTAQGVLSIDLGGTIAGARYDQLHVTGTVLLDGTLQVQLINGFSPALGDSFQVLTFNPGSVIGDFATVSLPTLDGGLFLAPTYRSTALSLVTLAG
jgi:hypothetical protein